MGKRTGCGRRSADGKGNDPIQMGGGEKKKKRRHRLLKKKKNEATEMEKKEEGSEVGGFETPRGRCRRVVGI